MIFQRIENVVMAFLLNLKDLVFKFKIPIGISLLVLLVIFRESFLVYLLYIAGTIGLIYIAAKSLSYVFRFAKGTVKFALNIVAGIVAFYFIIYIISLI